MTLRIVHGLGGLVLAYGSAHGPSPSNLVFDVGVVIVVLAAVAGWRAEHSLWGAWSALVTFCGFFALLGVQTFGLPDCGSFTQLASGAVACLASPNSRVITLSAIVGLVVGLALGTMDVASIRRRSPDSHLPDSHFSALRRGYLMLGTAIFGLTTVIALPTGVQQALSATLLQQSTQFGAYRQGADALGAGIVALVIWLVYLRLVVRELRAGA